MGRNKFGVDKIIVDRINSHPVLCLNRTRKCEFTTDSAILFFLHLTKPVIPGGLGILQIDKNLLSDKCVAIVTNLSSISDFKTITLISSKPKCSFKCSIILL